MFFCFFGNKTLPLSLRMSLVSGHYSTLFDFKGNVEEKLISETATSDGVKTRGGERKIIILSLSSVPWNPTDPTPPCSVLTQIKSSHSCPSETLPPPTPKSGIFSYLPQVKRKKGELGESSGNDTPTPPPPCFMGWGLSFEDLLLRERGWGMMCQRQFRVRVDKTAFPGGGGRRVFHIHGPITFKCADELLAGYRRRVESGESIKYSNHHKSRGL